MKRLLWALSGILSLLVVAACGGGGGGPTAPPPPPQPPAGVSFTASGASGPQTLSLRESPAGNDQRLVLELFAEQVSSVYGVAFDLRYPTAVLQFDAIVEGAFLGSGGADTTLQIAESPAGNLIVGLTRLGRIGGASGSGVLLTLEFSVVGSGDGNLSFIGNEAVNPEGEPLTGISWGAGSVSASL